MHIEIRVSKGKPKYQFKKDSNTKDKHFHSLDQGENGSHFYFEKTPNKLWVKRRTCKVLRFRLTCPQDYMSPTHTCTRHTLASNTHMYPTHTSIRAHLYPTHTCTQHTHTPQHTCTRHTHAPNTHMHPTHTCTRHTLVPETHLYPTHTCIRDTL